MLDDRIKNRYGTAEWFEQAYKNVHEDPWGLAWRPSQLLRYERVLTALDVVAPPPVRAIDVGCATGDFTDLLGKHFPGMQRIVGVDFVDSALERARGRFPHLTFAKESVLSLEDKYAGQFDLLTCLEVIYYVERDQQVKALRSLRSTLRPGGYALFSSFISPAPHFYPDEFVNLISSEFEVVTTQIIYLRLVSLIEKLGDRLERLLSLQHQGTAFGHKYGKLSPLAVTAVERWSRRLALLAGSHTIVLARNRG